MKQVGAILGCLALAVSTLGARGEPTDLSLNNRISECVEIIDQRYLLESEMPFVVVEIRSLMPVTQCGCSSLMSAYRVRTDDSGPAAEILGAKVTYSETGYKQLPLASSPELITGKNVQVTLSCAR